MQSMGQALDIEVLDKDEGNNDDKLGRWVQAPRRREGERAGEVRFGHASSGARDFVVYQTFQYYLLQIDMHLTLSLRYFMNILYIYFS